MVCKTACKQCAQTGLPVLFTRYAAAYSSTDPGAAALDKLKPGGKFKPQPGGIALHTAKYNVRMLRAGYLYIRMETSCRRPEWFGYVVHPHGYLTSFDVRHPDGALGLPACSPQEWGANRSLVWIKEADEVTRLNYMFHPDAIDPDHLKTVIENDPDKYMQSFDVAGWANGNRAALDTAVPGNDPATSPVADFKALKDEAVRNALEPQLYGLMGSSSIERGWGDWQERETTHHTGYSGETQGLEWDTSETVTKTGSTYTAAHGPRLQSIAAYLAAHKGAIVACEDPIGIAQELGHLQAEAQMGYTRWQMDQVPGAAPGVTNEWVFQTAVAAQSLQEMIRKGAVGRANKRIKAWEKMLDQQDERDTTLVRSNPALATQNADIRVQARVNQQREIAKAQTAGSEEFTTYFDSIRAAKIIEAQNNAYIQNAARLRGLGIDQVAWLNASGMKQAIRRYSEMDGVIDKIGGGASLSIQISHCIAGCDVTAPGQDWIIQADMFGDNPLARVISLNNKTLKTALQDMFNESLPASLPGAEPSTAWSEMLVDRLLKPYAARFALGDKAIEFAENSSLEFLSKSALMRKMTWPLHIASLFSVKMMQGVKNIQSFEAEAKVIKFVALTGFVCMGKTAAAYASTLNRADVDRLRNATNAIEKEGRVEGMAFAREGAPHARGAALAGVFDIANAIVKGYQLGIKKDSRTSVEMVGNLMQGTGSLLDWRAKAYEVTMYEGVRGEDIFTAVSQQVVSDTVNELRLRGMRMTAFRFLLPAAVIGMYWDGIDALQSVRRTNYALALAQGTSVAGAAFSIAAPGMTAMGALIGISASSWAMTACILGLVGAILSAAAVTAIIFLKEEEWLDWLKDIPLNKKIGNQKPIHANLRDTLQRLANAQASTA